ncbi:MAG: glycosyltransferase family 9 protein [Nitrospiraceae bacterium]
MRAAAFDLVVDLQGLFRSGAMTWLTSCPRRISFRQCPRGQSLFIRNGSRFPAPLCMPSTGTCWCRMPWGHRVLQFEFLRRPDDEAAIEVLLDRAGISTARGWIAAERLGALACKRWPAGHFAQLADLLQKSGARPVVLISRSAEQPESDAVKSLMQTKAVDLTGQDPCRLTAVFFEGLRSW